MKTILVVLLGLVGGLFGGMGNSHVARADSLPGTWDVNSCILLTGRATSCLSDTKQITFEAHKSPLTICVRSDREAQSRCFVTQTANPPGSETFESVNVDASADGKQFWITRVRQEPLIRTTYLYAILLSSDCRDMKIVDRVQVDRRVAGIWRQQSGSWEKDTYLTPALLTQPKICKQE